MGIPLYVASISFACRQGADYIIYTALSIRWIKFDEKFNTAELSKREAARRGGKEDEGRKEGEE